MDTLTHCPICGEPFYEGVIHKCPENTPIGQEKDNPDLETWKKLRESFPELYRFPNRPAVLKNSGQTYW